MAARYVRQDTTANTVDAVLLTADSVPEVLTFLGAGGHSWEPASEILSVETWQGAVINIRAGEYVLRSAGHVSHMPADAFEEAFKPLDAAPAPAPGEVAPGIDDEAEDG
jgi:hypothetical protein